MQGKSFMRQLRWLLLLLMWLSPVALAAPLPKGVHKVQEVEGIQEYRLDNGLKILLLPDESKPTLRLSVTYLVGSRHENYGETGMAHLLEHLLFKGSTHFRNIDREFSKRGMNSNATTSQDRTQYFEAFEAKPEHLYWAIDMEADRMVNAFVAKKDLDSEMTVVRNEYESGENSPMGVLMKRMQSVAFDWHNYSNSTIGNRSDIENVGIENLRAFYRKYYQPDNAVVTLVGKFDTQATLARMAKSFGRIAKPKRSLQESWTVEPTQDGERNFVVRRKGDEQMVLLAYKVPAGLHVDGDALDFARDILTDMPNGRLYKLLVETGKATSVYGGSGAGSMATGLLLIGADVKLGEPIEPVRDALIAAVESFYKTPPTPEEMTRVQRAYHNYYEEVFSSPQRIAGALTEGVVQGDWRLLLHARDRIDQVQPAQIQAVAAHYFKRDNRTVGMFLPEDNPQRAEIPAAPKVAEVLKNFKPHVAEAAGENFSPAQANIDARTQRLEIAGLKVAFLPKKNRGETVTVNFNLHWGDERSLFNQTTAAGMVGGMLMRGTTRFTRQQLADEMDRLRISGGVFGFETKRANLVEALKLMAHVLQAPTFPVSEFEQLRKQSLTGLESGRSDPDTLAWEAMSTHFDRYPKGDWRAAKSTEEAIADTQAVTLEQTKAFYQQFYGASHGEISIVGDFDPAEIRPVLQTLYSNWPSAAAYERLSNRNFEVTPLRKLINTPDKENGVYLARLNLDMRDDDADYPALFVANYLLGGGAGLDSRLMKRVRQQEGLSYHIGSGLGVGSLDRAANFSINAIAAPQNMLKVEVAVREELQRAVQQGFTAEELATAKSGILQKRLQARTNDGNLAWNWNNNLFLGRTFAWSKAFEDKLQALTVEQVNAAFRRAIHPEQLSVVMAFDQAKAAKP